MRTWCSLPGLTVTATVSTHPCSRMPSEYTAMFSGHSVDKKFCRRRFVCINACRPERGEAPLVLLPKVLLVKQFILGFR